MTYCKELERLFLGRYPDRHGLVVKLQVSLDPTHQTRGSNETSHRHRRHLLQWQKTLLRYRLGTSAISASMSRRGGRCRVRLGQTPTASPQAERRHGPLLQREATSLLPARHRSWSTIAWMICTPWSQRSKRKAATSSIKSTTPSTASLAGLSIPRGTRSSLWQTTRRAVKKASNSGVDPLRRALTLRFDAQPILWAFT